MPEGGAEAEKAWKDQLRQAKAETQGGQAEARWQEAPSQGEGPKGEGTMKRAIVATACAFLLTVLSASPAYAAFGLNGFSFGAETEGGGPVTQAGSHPFAVKTTFGLNYTGTGAAALPGGQRRNLVIHLPAGFAGAPSAVPECSHADFLHLNADTSQPSCPDSSAIGVAKAEIFLPGTPAPRAVYNL